MPAKVFLSYAAEDAEAAEATCHALESNGIQCWIAPRDIIGTQSWYGEVYTALDAIQVMVVIISSSVNASTQVLRDACRAADRKIRVVQVAIEDARPPELLMRCLDPDLRIDYSEIASDTPPRKLVDTVSRLLAPQEPRSGKGADPSVHKVAQAFAVLDGDETRPHDPFIALARRLAKKHSHLTVSLLQRRFHIGDLRAARIMDSLEEEGTVVRSDEGGPREAFDSEDEAGFSKAIKRLILMRGGDKR